MCYVLISEIRIYYLVDKIVDVDAKYDRTKLGKPQPTCCETTYSLPRLHFKVPALELATLHMHSAHTHTYAIPTCGCTHTQIVR